MSDAWEEIQAIKSKRNSLRERLEKRKKERQDILGSSLVSATLSPSNASENAPSTSITHKDELKPKPDDVADENLVKADPELENELLKVISAVTLQIPISSLELVSNLKITLERHASHRVVCNLLQKFATQKLIGIKEIVKDGRNALEINFVEHSKLNAMVEVKPSKEEGLKRKREKSPEKGGEEERKKEKKDAKANDLMVGTVLLPILVDLHIF